MNRLAPMMIGATIAASASASTNSISLASTMDADSFISENALTGGFGQISRGNGDLGSVGSNTGDADGWYDLNGFNDPNPALFGTPTDLFPREQNFTVGSLDYDDSGFSGVGVETLAVTALDLSGLWQSDQARTDTVNFGAPTVLSDISDYALGIVFFNGAGSIDFGALDSNDTVTFTDGQLTSIDVSVAADFIADAFGTQLTYSGALTFSGDGISFQINDEQPAGFFGNSTLVVDLDGTVNAVIPAPGAAALAAIAGLASVRRRRNA